MILGEQINNFKSSSHRLILLTVDDVINKEYVNRLKELNSLNSLNGKELSELVSIQNILLQQLGIYESIEDNSPQLGVLIPK